MILKLLNKIVTGWEVEHKFHPARRWRFDFSNPRLKIAVEIEGGAFIRGRHTRGAGFVKDMEKYNNAVLLGWRVLRYTPQQVGEMMTDVKELTRTGFLLQPTGNENQLVVIGTEKNQPLSFNF